MNWKTYNDNKITSQECEIAQWKNDKRKIDEESLQLYGLVKKATERLMNQISNFKDRNRMREIFKHKYLQVKGKLKNADQVMDIVKLNKLIF